MKNQFDKLNPQRYASHNKSKSKRVSMLGQDIKKLLAKTINNFISFDIKNTIVTITEVDLSPDLCNAKIFFVVSNETKKEVVLSYLEKKSYKIRLLIGEKIRLRKVPTVNMFIDKSFYQSGKIDRVLSSVAKN